MVDTFKDGIKETMGIPGATGENAIISAPILELTAKRADSVGSEMLPQTDKKANGQAAGASEGAMLWEDTLPPEKQLLKSL
jgi:hypothetical protein